MSMLSLYFAMFGNFSAELNLSAAVYKNENAFGSFVLTLSFLIDLISFVSGVNNLRLSISPVRGLVRFTFLVRLGHHDG